MWWLRFAALPENQLSLESRYSTKCPPDGAGWIPIRENARVRIKGVGMCTISCTEYAPAFDRVVVTTTSFVYWLDLYSQAPRTMERVEMPTIRGAGEQLAGWGVSALIAAEVDAWEP